MSSGDFVTQVLTTVGSTPCTTTNATQASLITTGFSGAAFTVSQTFAGTVSFYATADGGVNWSPVNVAPSNSTTPVTTATAPGLFRANVSGYTHVCVLLTALTSGTPTVSIHCSSDAASALSGGATGGGGGGPGITLTTAGTTGQSTLTGTVLNVPNYADISHLNLTHTGTSGASSLVSGTLNIPVYASGALNQVVLTTSSDVSPTSTSAASTGLGVAFTAQYNANVFVLFNCIAKNSITGVSTSIQVIRTTGTIPALGAAIPGPDVLVMYSRLFAAPVAAGTYTNVGAGNDAALTVGTPYNYYLACAISSASTFTISAGSVLQITEVK